MKKTAINLAGLLSFGVLLLSASCNRDDMPDPAGGDETRHPVEICVTLPGGMTSRADAADSTDPDAEYCYMQLLDNDGNPLDGDESAVRPMKKVAEGSFSLIITLDPTAAYDLLFWADNASETAPDDLAAVDYAADGATIAFAAMLDDSRWSQEGIQATLHHVVTRVSVETTAPATLDDARTLTVTVPRCYTAYNVKEMRPVAASEKSGFAFRNFVSMESAGHMGHFYLLGDAETTAQETLTLHYTGYLLNAPEEIPNVPMKPNYHITLKGDVANAGLVNGSISTIIDENWDGEATIPLEGFLYDDASNTYTVYNEKGLLEWAAAAREDLAANCILEADIVLTPPADPAGSNWTPVGAENNEENSRPYTGTFDGRGHTLSGLTVNMPETSSVGLFGKFSGTASDVTLEEVRISGNFSVGSVAGYLLDGTVTGCSVSGSVDGTNDTGGVVGTNAGTITGCSSSCEVTGEKNYIGGVAGYNELSITDCCATGAVSGANNVGGITGSNSCGTLTACCATGPVAGENNIGGVAGINNSGFLVACCATGPVAGENNIGGVAGINSSGFLVASYATGTVSGADGSTGGVAGINSFGTLSACCWSGYDGPGIGGSQGSDGTTKIDGTEVTWASACSDMNAAIERWNEESEDLGAAPCLYRFTPNADYDPAAPAGAPLELEAADD